MKNIYTIIIVILAFNFSLWAQNTSESGLKTKKVSTTYNRIALTTLVLNDGGEYVDDLKKGALGIEIPDKYDNNLLQKRHIDAKNSNKAIKTALENKHITNEILAKWFNRDPETGKFDMSVVHDRGLYNATDDEVMKASGSKIGVARLKDAGEALIKNSYIVVMRFSGIESMEEKAKKQAKTEKKKDQEDDDDEFSAASLLLSAVDGNYENRNGWVGNFKAYLFKLNFSDSIMNVFYNDLWIYDDDDESTAQAKKEKFEQLKLPVSFVMEGSGNANGSQYNDGEVLAPPVQLNRQQLFSKMINTGLNEAFYDFENEYEAFKVKAPLYGSKPLIAKIGKKEGLTSDQRFFVYEFNQKRNGETIAKRKGVIRVEKAVDNKSVATGKSDDYTTFYQTSGLGLMGGMLLQQKNDLGIGVGVSSGIVGEISGVSVKLEANVAVLGARFLGTDIGTNQFKIYGVLGFQNKKYSLPSFIEAADIYDFSFFRAEAGMSKGFYFAKNLSVTPFVGYGQETAESDDWTDASTDLADSTLIGTHYINIGSYATLNLTHWMQIVGTVNIYAPLMNAFDKSREDFLDTRGDSFKYTDVFDKRRGLSVELGLRIEF